MLLLDCLFPTFKIKMQASNSADSPKLESSTGNSGTEKDSEEEKTAESSATYHETEEKKQKFPLSATRAGYAAKKAFNSSATTVMKAAKKTGAVSLIKDFKSFISRGNVIDLAVALVVGSAFSAIVNSLVKDIISPLIALGMNGVSFGGYSVLKPGASGSWTYISITAAINDGAIVENWGAFLQTLFNFLIVSLCMFGIVRFIQALRRKKQPVDEKPCEFCCKSVNKSATRCPYCTSNLTQPQIK